jgi:hypothetical protein
MTNPFEQMVAFGDQTGNIREPVTQQQFEQWRQEFTFDALHGQRYGQSFCNRFGITDNLLYFTTWSVEQIDRYIEKNYVDRSRYE